MKPTLLSLSFLLLFAFTTNLPLAFSIADIPENLVVDTNGNQIFAGQPVYILPAIVGPPGGGLELGKTGNYACPVTVLQQYSEVIKGLPVRFSIQGISLLEICTGSPLDISFTKKPNCAESSKWVVVLDDYPKAWLGIGGAEDHPKKLTLGGTFLIQKYRFGYKLVFCPIAAAPPGLCFNIGRHDDYKHGRRLVLTDTEDAFEVVFVSALPPGNSIV